MKIRTPQQCQAYLQSFVTPEPAGCSVIQDGRVGLIVLPPDQFRYSRDLGYAFEVAVVEEAGTSRRLLFIRIDSWDPKRREAGEPVDYCIPLACEGGSPREQLTRTIPFGGGWSDARAEVLLVFPSDWVDWFRRLVDGVAFTNPEAESACFLSFGDRERVSIEAFCG
jgi:hypothetical protein